MQKILLVEDEKGPREAFELWLKNDRYEVVTASNEDAAIKIIRDDEFDCNILIADMKRF